MQSDGVMNRFFFYRQTFYSPIAYDEVGCKVFLKKQNKTNEPTIGQDRCCLLQGTGLIVLHNKNIKN